MKNKFLLLLLLLLTHVNIAHSQEEFYNFQTKTIEILNDGNLIKAKFGKVISFDKKFEVRADYFELNKDSKILKVATNGEIFIKSSGLKIKFDNAIIDGKKSIFQAYDKLIAENPDVRLIIYSKKITFNFKEDTLFSSFKTNFEYNNQINFAADNFKYEFDNNLLKIKNLDLLDQANNKLNSSIAYINTKTNNLYGKDIFISLNNETLNKENEPRLKGNSVIENEKQTQITKGVFTNCKKTDDCPPWEISAKKIIHNKIDKTINYENAILKIYNNPIAYLPKFSHPDPTVKRKSGFLIPSFKTSSNQNNYLSLPYYLVVADNKDLTFNPRVYDNEEFFLGTEYRQVNKNSKQLSDFSFKINDDKKLKSHFFYKYNKDFNLDNFIENDIELKIQTVSKDTYLKKNKIKSNMITSDNLLENSIKFSTYSSTSSLVIQNSIYEDLGKNKSDRFEYVIPKIDIKKNLDTPKNLNGNLFLNSKTLARNYNTNVFESININDLIFKSNPKITSKGIFTNYELLVKNSNTDSKNSTSFKNKENIYLSSLIQLNSSLPLTKEDGRQKKILTPKLALKLSPKHTKNIKDKDIKIDISNIYSLHRSTEEDMIEGGISLTYGNEFSIFDKQNSIQILDFKVANSLRLEENNKLPNNSQIGHKTSSFVNELTYQPIENFKINYNSSIKNNLTEINHENLTAEFKLNNIVTTFGYLNQNELSNTSYFSNTTKLILNETKALSFSTRKNKITNLTEYYNLAYQYENDCLAASVEYNKDYYSDRDLKPSEGISFKLTITPFNNDSRI